MKIILHQLLHTWQYFSFNAGAISYPAHGSLLSWYWNSMIFPWDADVDVILPIQDLSSLCMNYNNSMIIQSPTDGFAKYYLDCTSSITIREHGNGANNIDARFIDVDSGIYIDLTGLAVTGDPGMPKEDKIHFGLLEKENGTDVDIYKLHDEFDIYNCRNFHFYSHADLSPMRLSSMENSPVLIPKNIEQSLLTEYHEKALTEKLFEHHIFVDELQLWVPNINILRSIRKLDPEIQNDEKKLYQYYKDHRIDVIKSLLNDETMLIELTQVYLQTKAHELSTDLLANLDSFDPNNTTDPLYLKYREEYVALAQSHLIHHQPMRKSMYDYMLEVEMLQLNMDLEFKRDEVLL